MALLGTLLRMFGDSTACGDRETLIQPGGRVNVECMLPSGHDGNHYDSRNVLEWGDDPHHDYKDRPSHFG